MFSRSAKFVVKSFGLRRIHIGEKNFKIALIGGAGEISQTLSQLLKNSAKSNALALYDVAAVNKPLPNYNFYNEQPFKTIPSEMLTKAKKSCSGEGRSNAARQTDNNHQGNDGTNQTEKLVEALYRLPIAEDAPAFNSSLIPIEEMIPKLQEENLAVRFGESGIIGERRERSSSSMKSTVEIAESGKPIESNQIQTSRRSLSINSRQQFIGINSVKANLQQDPNSAVDYKDRFDFAFLDKYFVTDPHNSGDHKFEGSKSHGDRQGNDDYFPQGEEYEEEIGTDDYQLNKKAPKKKSPPHPEGEYDLFKPTILMFENNKSINGGPLTRFITRVHFSSEELTEADRTMLMSKKVSNKDAVEKLQTLIEKVTEFKRRVFRPKHDELKIGATMNGKKEKKNVNENKSNESMKRSSSIKQKISTSAC